MKHAVAIGSSSSFDTQTIQNPSSKGALRNLRIGRRGNLRGLQLLSGREGEFSVAAQDSGFELINGVDNLREGVVMFKRFPVVANVEVNFVGDTGFNVNLVKNDAWPGFNQPAVMDEVQPHVLSGKVRLS